MDGLPWRLGAAGPVQQSPVTCGSAALTVARMLADPAFARWVVTGVGRATAAHRTAGPSRQVRRATSASSWAGPTRSSAPGAGSSCHGPGRSAPRRGEHCASSRRAAAARDALPVAAGPLRIGRLRSRATYRQLVHLVRDGRPALLYVGNALTPRHVTLVLPGDGEAVLDVYDPATGTVTALDEGRYVARRLALAGWDVPWVLVQPATSQPATASPH